MVIKATQQVQANASTQLSNNLAAQTTQMVSDINAMGVGGALAAVVFVQNPRAVDRNNVLNFACHQDPLLDWRRKQPINCCTARQTILYCGHPMVMLSKLSTKSKISGFTSTSCSIEITLKTCTFCPGIDGRKNSFTGYTSHRKSSNDGDFDERDEVDCVGNPSSYDNSSVDEVDLKRKKAAVIIIQCSQWRFETKGGRQV